MVRYCNVDFLPFVRKRLVMNSKLWYVRNHELREVIIVLFLDLDRRLFTQAPRPHPGPIGLRLPLATAVWVRLLLRDGASGRAGEGGEGGSGAWPLWGCRVGSAGAGRRAELVLQTEFRAVWEPAGARTHSVQPARVLRVRTVLTERQSFHSSPQNGARPSQGPM